MGIRLLRLVAGPGFADHDGLGRQVAGRREQGEAFDQLAPGILWRRFIRARAFGCFHVPMTSIIQSDPAYVILTLSI